MLKTPTIIVNFKAYRESLGKKAVELARIAEEVSRELNVSIAVAPQATDIRLVASAVSIPVFAQAVDSVAVGALTGHVTIESIKDAGAVGTIINHSERRVQISLISEVVKASRELNLTTVVCADTPEVTAAVASLNPEFVAIEPPELIGTGIPVSKAKPEVVTNSLEKVRSVNSKSKVICGAGITTGDDVKAALRLGTVGVLLASGVVKAKDPKKVLIEMGNALIESL
ncbi:triose-phosphate isomerase [archaeon]|jgi:triosephosphate isomerase|nr:triose-phosphate isomerase [archaeon]